MSRTTFTQQSFNAGELSPLLHGRSDIKKYSQGVETMTNAIPLVQGAVRRRPGTKWIADLDDVSTYTRYAGTGQLIPFYVSGESGIVIDISTMETGAGVDSRGIGTFYQDGARLENASPGSADYSTFVGLISSDFTKHDISYVQYGTRLYMANGQGGIYFNDFSGSANDPVFNGGSLFSMSPPPTAELGTYHGTRTISITAGANPKTLTVSSDFFTDGDVGRYVKVQLSGEPPAYYSVVGYTSGTVLSVDFYSDIAPSDTSSVAYDEWELLGSPCGDISFTLTGSGVPTVGTKVTIDSVGGSPNVFSSHMPLGYIVANNGIIKLTETSGVAQMKGIILKAMDDTTSTSIWTFETAVITDQFPTATAEATTAAKLLGFHENRLVIANTGNNPQTVWFSAAGINDDFGHGASDSDSFSINIPSTKLSEISWLSSSRELNVGTTTGEFTISSPNSSALTPSSVKATTRTTVGSDRQQPATFGVETLFVPRSQKTVRSLRYDFNIDGYISEDLLQLANHLPDGTTIKKVAISFDPVERVYAVLDDGDMMVATYVREQQVLGWAKWTMSNGAKYLDIAIVNGTNGDDIYVAVSREDENGSIIESIEIFDKIDNDSVTDEATVFSDSSVVIDSGFTITGITQASPGVVTTSAAHGFSNADTVIIHDVVGMTEVNTNSYKVANVTATTFELTDSSDNNIDTSAFTAYDSAGTVYKKTATITVDSRYNGLAMQVKGDGVAQTDATPAAGTLTLATSAAQVVAGFEYETTIKTLKREFPVLGNSGQGQRSRFIRPILRIYQSVIPALDGELLPDSTDNADAVSGVLSPLYDGDLMYSNLGWSNKGQVTVSTSDPYPMTLLGIFGTSDMGAV